MFFFSATINTGSKAEPLLLLNNTIVATVHEKQITACSPQVYIWKMSNVPPAGQNMA
jgi:hypothetical protein